MARTKAQVFSSMVESDPVGFAIPWAVIFPLILGLCPNKAPTEQHAWVRNNRARAVSMTAREVEKQTPGLSKREARIQARKAVDQYLTSSDADIAVAAGGE